MWDIRVIIRPDLGQGEGGDGLGGVYEAPAGHLVLVLLLPEVPAHRPGQRAAATVHASGGKNFYWVDLCDNIWVAEDMTGAWVWARAARAAQPATPPRCWPGCSGCSPGTASPAPPAQPAAGPPR